MPKNRKVKWIIVTFLVIVLISPMIFIEAVYQKGLAEIQKPLPSPCGMRYPKRVQEAFWYGYDETGVIKIVPEMPWTITYALFRALITHDPAMRTTFNPKGSRVATRVARQYLLGYKGPNLNWELMNAALAIWLTRHWTSEVLLNELAEKCYYGRNAYGMNQASHVYFKLKPEDLDENQIVTLVAMTFSPVIYSKDEKALNEKRDKILALVTSRGNGVER